MSTFRLFLFGHIYQEQNQVADHLGISKGPGKFVFATFVKDSSVNVGNKIFSYDTIFCFMMQYFVL